MEVLSLIAAASAAITIQASAPLYPPNAEVSKACNEEIVDFAKWSTPVISIMRSTGNLVAGVYQAGTPEQIAIIKPFYRKAWEDLRPKWQSHLSAMEIACHGQGIDAELAEVAGRVADVFIGAERAIAAMEKEPQ